MRRVFFFFLCAVAVCGLGLFLGLRRGDRPTSTLLHEFNTRVRVGVVLGESVIIAAGEEGLLRVPTGETGEVRRIVAIPGQVILDVVAGDNVLYALTRSTTGRRYILHHINPDTGAVDRSIALGGSVSDLVDMQDGERLAVIEAGQVRFIVARTGVSVGRVPVGGGILGGGHLEGDRLYVTRELSGGLAIIDTKKFELIEVIKTGDRLKRVAATGRRAYVVGESKGVGCIDLDSRSFTMADMADVFSTGGHLYALYPDAVHRLDAMGESVDRARIPGALGDEIARGGATVIAIEPEYILVARGKRLYKLVSTWESERGKAQDVTGDG